MLDRGEQVEETREQEEDGRHNQAGGSADQADPLDDAHDQVHDDAGPVLLEAAEEATEALGPDGELQQECHFNKEDDRCICPNQTSVSCGSGGLKLGAADSNSQAYDAEDDGGEAAEDVGDAHGEAQDHTQYAGPTSLSAACISAMCRAPSAAGGQSTVQPAELLRSRSPARSSAARMCRWPSCSSGCIARPCLGWRDDGKSDCRRGDGWYPPLSVYTYDQRVRKRSLRLRQLGDVDSLKFLDLSSSLKVMLSG